MKKQFFKNIWLVILIIIIAVIYTAMSQKRDIDQVTQMPVANITEAPQDKIGSSTTVVNIIDDYDKTAFEYEKKYNLPPGFADWMIKEKNRYSKLFKKARHSKNIVAAVYYENPIAYNPPWKNEKEHMETLEQFVELTFPGWNFEFMLNGDKEKADVVVYLGSKGVSRAPGKTVYLVYETIFSHEFGHTLGLPHLYLQNDASDMGKCSFCPPGEGKSIMDRNSTQWGASERFLLDIPFDIDNSDKIQTVLENILDRYPY